VQQSLIKKFRKRVCRIVVHGPTGAHHAAHADLDQLAGDTVSEPVIGDRPSIHLGEMTAVEKDQIRHDFHLADFRGGQKQPIGQHHAAACLAVRRAQVEKPMSGDVNNPIGLLIKRIDHL
jgi:hypothetical protein